MNSPGGISTVNTLVPRFIAASLDNLVAMILGVVAAKMVSEELAALQVAGFVVVYLGYYFAFEVATSRTPGKLLTGLIVVRTDGSPATLRDTVIRTAMRVLEVNPLLLGAFPAALSVVFSANHQRFGDKLAGTIVVPRDRLSR
jgi:uncharacterized RDD family membrane protein YckC